jgi:uncharacterized MAPEG superfamily protein
MTPELTALTLAALLQVVQFVLSMSVPANLELGPDQDRLAARPRPDGRLAGGAAQSTKTARLLRALDNHFEGLILFGIACTVITVSGQSTGFTDRLRLDLSRGARPLHVPAYYFGWAPWRSLIWFVGFTATTLILLAALL